MEVTSPSSLPSPSPSVGGGVSLYGAQRFPVTFSADQWIRILDFGPSIREVIDNPTNVPKILRKSDIDYAVKKAAFDVAKAASNKAYAERK